METGLGIEDKLIEPKAVNPNGGLDQNFREFSAGAGSSVFKVNQDGVFIGAETYASAPFKVNYQGHFSVGNGGSNSVSWNGSALSIRGSLNADDITAGTLTGRTVKAKGTGSAADVWMDGSTGSVRFFYDGAEKSFIWSDTDGSLLIDSDVGVFIKSEGNGDDVFLWGDSMTIVSNGSIINTFNDDGGSGTCNWINDTSLDLQLQDDGDLSLPNGSYT